MKNTEYEKNVVKMNVRNKKQKCAMCIYLKSKLQFSSCKAVMNYLNTNLLFLSQGQRDSCVTKYLLFNTATIFNKKVNDKFKDSFFMA